MSGMPSRRPAGADAGRILVADDQAPVRSALQLLLKIRGYEVTAVSSPAAVLAALLGAAHEPFDLLLMDLNYARDTTSGQEGLELVSRVHALDPALPIVVMTAWSTVPLAVATMREGRVDFVEKPWDNQRLVATVASQVEAGRRRRRTQRLESDARAVQRRLLARGLPQVPGFEVGVAWSFAESLGGDAYAVAGRPGGAMAVAIADVCGKGTPAALLMASAQATLEDLLAGPLPPRDVCVRLGEALQPRLGPDRFVSFACVVLDPALGTITSASAGHPPPVLLREGGVTQPLESGGPVLGIVGAAAYDQSETPLGARDRLLLVTDGVLEACAEPGGDEWGHGRLVDALRRTAGRSATDAAAAILAEARDFARGTLADDATVLVVDAADPR
jgi:sigma-B regulation protein RsbU (phosphoserine phosphatase)